MTIMQMVKIFSLSVSGATLPKPMLVMQVMVKYSEVMYIVERSGPPSSSNFIVTLFGLKWNGF